MKRDYKAMGFTDDERHRMELFDSINSQVVVADEAEERARLEKEWGRVWNSEELREEFEVFSFAAPFCIVVRKKDLVPGYLMFQHSPRLYFGFEVGEPPSWELVMR